MEKGQLKEKSTQREQKPMKAMGLLSKPGSFRVRSPMYVVCVAPKREAMPKASGLRWQSR